MTERWLSLGEIVDNFGLKRDTVNKLFRSTEAPFHKIRRLDKFQIKEVDQWLKEDKLGAKILN